MDISFHGATGEVTGSCLLITVGVFLSFRSISGHVTGLAEEDQLNEVGSLVLTGIQTVSRELTYNDRAEIKIEIPKDISRQAYTLIADGSVLTVLLRDGKNATLGLEGAEDAYLVLGRVTSAGGLRVIGTQNDKTIRLVRDE